MTSPFDRNEALRLHYLTVFWQSIGLSSIWKVSEHIFVPSNWTSPDCPFGRSVNVYFDHPIICSRVVQMYSPYICIWMVQINSVKAFIWTANFCPNGWYLFVYLDASKSTVQGRPNGHSLNGRFRYVQVDRFFLSW